VSAVTPEERERELIEAFDADLIDEPEELQADELVVELMDELGIVGTIRAQMLADAGRARAVLAHAKASNGVRNPAAFAIANWRARFDPRGRVIVGAPPRELVEEPPTLAALEYVWSLPATPVTAAIERMMTVAIERNGGARALLAGAGLRPLPPQQSLELE
jgi:hypothetical protein